MNKNWGIWLVLLIFEPNQYVFTGYIFCNCFFLFHQPDSFSSSYLLSTYVFVMEVKGERKESNCMGGSFGRIACKPVSPVWNLKGEWFANMTGMDWWIGRDGILAFY